MFEQIKNQIRTSSILVKVIALNVLVFLLIHIVYVPLSLMQVDGIYSPNNTFKMVYWLSTPANLQLLLFRPWTLFTSMFLHSGIWHLFVNMLLLYFTGRIFCDMLNGKRFLPLYILGGLAGVTFFIIGYNIFPKLYAIDGAFILGASAAVMAIFIATATYLPTYEVYLFGVLKVQLQWLAIIYVIIDFVALGGVSNIGGHLAHLGGALFGFIYSKRLSNGHDLASVFYTFSDFLSRFFAPKSHMKVSHRSQRNYSTVQSINKTPQQKTIDEILDKISRSGYESLSRDEKDILFKASKE